MSIASLFTLELQTDHQPSHYTPVSTTELIKLWSAAVCMSALHHWFNCCTCLHTVHICLFLLMHALTLSILFVFQTRMSVKMV